MGSRRVCLGVKQPFETGISTCSPMSTWDKSTPRINRVCSPKSEAFPQTLLLFYQSWLPTTGFAFSSNPSEHCLKFPGPAPTSPAGNQTPCSRCVFRGTLWVVEFCVNRGILQPPSWVTRFVLHRRTTATFKASKHFHFGGLLEGGDYPLI